MPTLTTLISSIAEARKALESGDRQLAEKVDPCRNYGKEMICYSLK